MLELAPLRLTTHNESFDTNETSDTAVCTSSANLGGSEEAAPEPVAALPNSPLSPAAATPKPQLGKVVFPTLEFVVKKQHHSMRWLKQVRVLRLRQEGLENALNKDLDPAPLKASAAAAPAPAAAPGGHGEHHRSMSQPPQSQQTQQRSACRAASLKPSQSCGAASGAASGGESEASLLSLTLSSRSLSLFLKREAGASGQQGLSWKGGGPAQPSSGAASKPCKSNSFVTKFLRYDMLERVQLVDNSYFVLHMRDDHDYHYHTPDAVRIVWEIEQRIKARDARRTFYNYLMRRVGQSDASDIANAFQAHNIPSPIDLQSNLQARQRESILELRLREVLLDTHCSEGRAMQVVVERVGSLLSAAAGATGYCRTLHVVTRITDVITDFKTHISTKIQRERRAATTRPPTAGSGSSNGILFEEAPGAFATLRRGASKQSVPDSVGDTLSVNSRQNESFGGEILSPMSDSAFVERQGPIRVGAEQRKKYRHRRGSRACLYSALVGKGLCEGFTDDELSTALDHALQKAVFQDSGVARQLNHLILRDSDLKTKRAALKRNMQLVSRKSPAFFGVPKSLEGCVWEDAVRKLDSMERKTLPCQKMECITDMIRQLVATANVDSGSCAPLALDDVLPLVIYSITRCSLPEPWAEAQMIYAAHDRHAADERAYYLTVFFSALEFLCTLDATSPFSAEACDEAPEEDRLCRLDTTESIDADACPTEAHYDSENESCPQEAEMTAEFSNVPLVT